MKQILAGSAVVLVGVLVLGVTLAGGRPRPPAANLSAPPARVDLMTLWSAFRDDPAAAGAAYGGRVVELAGPVLMVEKVDGEACLFLFDIDLAGSRPARARCLFRASAYPELARLIKMAPVRVRGTPSWEPESLVGSAVVLSDCTLVGP
jgi:hypothetical protein